MRTHYLKGLLILSIYFLPMFLFAQKQAKKPIRVLIVDGFSNHDWKQTTKIVKQILDGSGLFIINVSTAPESPADSVGWASWEPDFKNYDVVIQNTNNIQNPKIHWPQKIQHELEDYVQSGGGLYILHSANNAFPDWEEYNKMIGLGWRAKTYGYALIIDSVGKIERIPPGEGKATYHDDRSDLHIHEYTNHPINKGFPKEWITPDAELYRYARGPAENLTVLSYAYDPRTNKNWPVEWIVKYGKGKVYVSSMGHLWKGDVYPLGYRCIGFQTTMIRAVEWLGSGKVTYPVPANFPTATAKSVADADK
jgi:type 1 glutamine amidotransferase